MMFLRVSTVNFQQILQALTNYVLSNVHSHTLILHCLLRYSVLKYLYVFIKDTLKVHFWLK